MMTTRLSIGPGSTAVQRDGPAAKLIRGSSLLFCGRLIGLALNLAVQVLAVRYLSKKDYGAFAYALAVVAMGSSVAAFGLNKTITRFVPIYQEQDDYDRVFGTLLMMIGTVLSLGLAVVLLVHALYQGGHPRGVPLPPDRLAGVLLVSLIGLVPVQALDCLIESAFAVFARPRAIFFRRFLLTPGLRLGVVLLLVFRRGDVHFLAAGNLLAGILGVSICTLTLVFMLRHQGLFQHFNLRGLKMPARDIFGFTVPLLASDLVFVLQSSLLVVLLEHFRGAADVAAFRAVMPIAGLNLVVFQSFAFLFTPLAARLFARKDRKGLHELYWQTAAWIAVLSFPVFAATVSLARPLTLLLYGGRYEQSALLLAVLSLGHYFNAALGFNGHTLRVFSKVRYLVRADLIGAVVSLGMTVALIVRYGSLGAAIGASGSLVAQNLLYQAGLRLGTGIPVFEWRYLGVYLAILLGALGLLLVQLLFAPPVYVAFTLLLVVSCTVVRSSRGSLNVEQTFPEVLRFPLARWLFAV